MENLCHGGIFPWRCQSRETETRLQSAATSDGKAEERKDEATDQGDTSIGALAFESTRMDTGFKLSLIHI